MGRHFLLQSLYIKTAYSFQKTQAADALAEELSTNTWVVREDPVGNHFARVLSHPGASRESTLPRSHLPTGAGICLAHSSHYSDAWSKSSLKTQELRDFTLEEVCR